MACPNARRFCVTWNRYRLLGTLSLILLSPIVARAWTQPPVSGSFPPEIYAPPPGDAVAGLWPWPTGNVAVQASTDRRLLCLATDFRMRAVGFRGSRRLDFGMKHYSRIIERASPSYISVSDGCLPKTLDGLDIFVRDSDLDRPLSLDTNESYELHVLSPRGLLRAESAVGALRGLEAFSQLILKTANGDGSKDAADMKLRQKLAINGSAVSIVDSPRFPHRGLMLDSSRHFLPVRDIEVMLDAMLYNRLNVLHWHISDAQAFPLRTAFSVAHGLDKGAYSSKLSYSAADLMHVVEAASLRGIRVIPEIDTPSHVQSWATLLPLGYFVDCGYNTVLNMVNESVVALVDEFVQELVSIFPDPFFHIGTDEVDFGCLNKSADVLVWLEKRGLQPDEKGMKAVVAHWIGSMQTVLKRHGRTAVVWNEAFDHYGASRTSPPVELEKDTIVELWFAPTWGASTIDIVTSAGYRGLLAPDGPWYLDGGVLSDWQPVYLEEPLTNKTCTYVGAVPNCTCTSTFPCFEVSPQYVSKVLGGEAAVWGEHVDGDLLQFQTWPRASAVAERLWSRREVNDLSAAWARLAMQRCRMKARGVAVTPLGPGDQCNYEVVSVKHAENSAYV